jgi:hypothetical protein
MPQKENPKFVKRANPDQFVSVPKSDLITASNKHAREYLKALQQQKKRKIKPSAPLPGRLPIKGNTMSIPTKSKPLSVQKPKQKPLPVSQPQPQQPQQQFYYQQTSPLDIDIDFDYEAKAPRTIKSFKKPLPVPQPQQDYYPQTSPLDIDIDFEYEPKAPRTIKQYKKPLPAPQPRQQYYYPQTNPLDIGFDYEAKAPRTKKQYIKPQPKFDHTRIFKQMSSFDIVNPLNQMNIKKLRDALNKKISQNRRKAPEYLTKQQLEPALKLMQELKFKYNYPFTQTGEKIYQDYKKLLEQASKKPITATIDDSFSGWNKPAPGTFPLSVTQMKKLYGTMHLGRRY